MDNIFDRAHDMLDKAQGRVASAAAQAAWTANQGLLIRDLEGQLAALQGEIARVTREIGERVYAAWKARADDPRVPALCGHLDGLQEQRDRVGADLAAARAATFDPNSYQPPATSYQRLPAGTQPPSIVPPRPIPAISPAQQPPSPVIEGVMAPPPAQPAPPTPSPRPAASPPAPPPAPQPAPQPARNWDTGPAAAQPAQASAPAAQSAVAPEQRARECPNCGHYVPAGVEYCSSCGIRVV